MLSCSPGIDSGDNVLQAAGEERGETLQEDVRAKQAPLILLPVVSAVQKEWNGVGMEHGEYVKEMCEHPKDGE